MMFLYALEKSSSILKIIWWKTTMKVETCMAASAKDHQRNLSNWNAKCVNDSNEYNKIYNVLTIFQPKKSLAIQRTI